MSHLGGVDGNIIAIVDDLLNFAGNKKCESHFQWNLRLEIRLCRRADCRRYQTCWKRFWIPIAVLKIRRKKIRDEKKIFVIDFTCQNAEQEQVLGVADDAFVPERPKQHRRAMLESWRNFLQLLNLLWRQNLSLQPRTRVLFHNGL